MSCWSAITGTLDSTWSTVVGLDDLFSHNPAVLAPQMTVIQTKGCAITQNNNKAIGDTIVYFRLMFLYFFSTSNFTKVEKVIFLWETVYFVLSHDSIEWALIMNSFWGYIFPDVCWQGVWADKGSQASLRISLYLTLAGESRLVSTAAICWILSWAFLCEFFLFLPGL